MPVNIVLINVYYWFLSHMFHVGIELFVMVMELEVVSNGGHCRFVSDTEKVCNSLRSK